MWLKICCKNVVKIFETYHFSYINYFEKKNFEIVFIFTYYMEIANIKNNSFKVS